MMNDETGNAVILDTARHTTAEPGLANTLRGVSHHPAGIFFSFPLSVFQLFLRARASRISLIPHLTSPTKWRKDSILPPLRGGTKGGSFYIWLENQSAAAPCTLDKYPKRLGRILRFWV